MVHFIFLFFAAWGFGLLIDDLTGASAERRRKEASFAARMAKIDLDWEKQRQFEACEERRRKWEEEWPAREEAHKQAGQARFDREREERAIKIRAERAARREAERPWREEQTKMQERIEAFQKQERERW
jgi:hypothetical protein